MNHPQHKYFDLNIPKPQSFLQTTNLTSSKIAKRNGSFYKAVCFDWLARQSTGSNLRLAYQISRNLENDKLNQSHTQCWMTTRAKTLQQWPQIITRKEGTLVMSALFILVEYRDCKHCFHCVSFLLSQSVPGCCKTATLLFHWDLIL